MAELITSRRRFLMGAGVILAAPAIVRVANLMPISVLEPGLQLTFHNGGWPLAPLAVRDHLTISGSSSGYNGVYRVTGRTAGGTYLVQAHRGDR
jgi:hypothetical protein